MSHSRSAQVLLTLSIKQQVMGIAIFASKTQEKAHPLLFNNRIILRLSHCIAQEVIPNAEFYRSVQNGPGKGYFWPEKLCGGFSSERLITVMGTEQFASLSPGFSSSLVPCAQKNPIHQKVILFHQFSLRITPSTHSSHSCMSATASTEQKAAMGGQGGKMKRERAAEEISLRHTTVCHL